MFQHNGVTFRIVISSDDGYIEPTRLLALQGAKIVFAPHFNYFGKEGLICHFMKVRADRTARTVENGVYFVRGNNVSLGKEECITKNVGVGYGDSYFIDPHGEIVVSSRRHVEDFLFADIDPNISDRSWHVGRSVWSAHDFGSGVCEPAEFGLGGKTRRVHTLPPSARLSTQRGIPSRPPHFYSAIKSRKAASTSACDRPIACRIAA